MTERDEAIKRAEEAEDEAARYKTALQTIKEKILPGYRNRPDYAVEALTCVIMIASAALDPEIKRAS